MATATDAAISSKMRRVRSSNTTPEIIFRKALWKRGLRYSICQPDLPGKPDVVFHSPRIAIFIDGDLWHGGQWRLRGKVALEDQFSKTASKQYWLEKIRRNIERDCRVTTLLLRSGWTVIRFWESDVLHHLEKCIDTTMQAFEKKVKITSHSLLPLKSFAEFFAGIGLVRVGLESEGWCARFANDIDHDKARMYRDHFGDSSDLIVKDIGNLTSNEVPSVTLATASFPCNDLSIAGARAGLNGGASSAFWAFIKILKNLKTRRPPLVLLENVTGFLSSNGGADFKDALVALSKLGYSVDAFILDAVDFVPHSRKRLFVIGVLESLIRPVRGNRYTEGVESRLRPKRLIQFIQTHRNIRWNIRPLPDPPKRKTTLPDLLEDLSFESSEWWSPKRAEYLLNQMSPQHRAVAEKMIAGREWAYGTVFRRMRNRRSTAELRIDGIAGCLRTPRGGSGRQILFKAGKGKYRVRLLTPRDTARLMGADKFKISVSGNQALFGFGDAVCVPVVEWIAKYYLNPLVNELIRSSPLVPTVVEVYNN